MVPFERARPPLADRDVIVRSTRGFVNALVRSHLATFVASISMFVRCIRRVKPHHCLQDDIDADLFIVESFHKSTVERLEFLQVDRLSLSTCKECRIQQLYTGFFFRRQYTGSFLNAYIALYFGDKSTITVYILMKLCRLVVGKVNSRLHQSIFNAQKIAFVFECKKR